MVSRILRSLSKKEHKGNVRPLSMWDQAEPDISMGSYFRIASRMSDKIMINCHI